MITRAKRAQVVNGYMDQKNKIQPLGRLWNALGGLAQLLPTDPQKVEKEARELLAIMPAQQQALQLVVNARRVQNDVAGAREFLEAMATERPGLAAVHYELGLLLAEIGETGTAIKALSRVVELEPDHPSAWRALGEELAQSGDSESAAKAFARHCRSSINDVKVIEDANALDVTDIETAVGLLTEFLNIFPTDVNATRILGELYMRVNRNDLAEELFKRALELAPDFTAVRVDYVLALHAQMKWREEDQQLYILLENNPDDPGYLYYKATVLFRLGQTEESLRFCENLIRKDPDNARFRLAYAYALRSAGRVDDCVAELRKSVELEPGMGESWWGLANLKTFRFSPAEIETLRTQLSRTDLEEEERCHIHFALGKALEDSKQYFESLQQYQLGNASRRSRNPFDADAVDKSVRQTKRRFSREFFRVNGSRGCPSEAPIFIPGLPRSGSTLVEQILSSHSMVEGLGELPCMGRIAVRAALGDDGPDDEMSSSGGHDWRALGEEYLKSAGTYRKLDRARFADKMPGNFANLGLICTMLPNAKIVDVRRHPLDCCLSNFKQNFPNGSGPSYDLADMGRSYYSYVELMAHFDEVLPGRVYRLFYEDLVRDPEAEIRRLLEYCDLPFEERCLRHHESDRSVLTASSEQVRRPVNREGLNQWQPYEQWLGPLKKALGPVLEMYPAVPENFGNLSGNVHRAAVGIAGEG
jgi:predicted Zn-dependent protease